jgi:exopolysaccharide biosynthesis polyprenyl glycosylphosphotransferase
MQPGISSRRETAVSDPAIVSGGSHTDELIPAAGSAAPALGQPTRSTSAETILRPLPTPDPSPATLRRWMPHAVLVDVAMLAVANVLFLATDPGPGSWLALLVAFDAIAIGLIAAWRGYAPRLRLDALDDLRMTVTSSAVATMTVVSIDALVYTDEPSSYAALRLWILATVLLALGRLGSNLVAAWRRESSRTAATTIIVGAGRVGRLTASRLLDHPEFGLHPIGFLDAEPMEISGKPLPLPVLGTSANLPQVIATQNVDCAVVAFSTDSHDALLELLDECEELGIRTLIVPRLFERVPSRLQVTHVGGLPLLEMLPTSLHSIQFAVKYVLDRLAALALVVALSPLLLAISAAVAVSLGRPILYRQDRVSLDGRRFNMLKFRTMQNGPGETEDGKEFDPEIAPGGVEGADRRTRVGAFLRSWSLDELPQLLNVLRGEMSLVGPRPERPEYVEYFREHVRRYDGRLRTKAGITGWAQIHRLRGQTSISDRVEWDNYYIENFSLWLDFKILLRTIPEALKGRAN